MLGLFILNIIIWHDEGKAIMEVFIGHYNYTGLVLMWPNIKFGYGYE